MDIRPLEEMGKSIGKEWDAFWSQFGGVHGGSNTTGRQAPSRQQQQGATAQQNGAQSGATFEQLHSDRPNGGSAEREDAPHDSVPKQGQQRAGSGLVSGGGHMPDGDWGGGSIGGGGGGRGGGMGQGYDQAGGHYEGEEEEYEEEYEDDGWGYEGEGWRGEDGDDDGEMPGYVRRLLSMTDGEGSSRPTLNPQNIQSQMDSRRSGVHDIEVPQCVHGEEMDMEVFEREWAALSKRRVAEREGEAYYANARRAARERRRMEILERGEIERQENQERLGEVKDEFKSVLKMQIKFQKKVRLMGISLTRHTPHFARALVSIS
jgi:hypothetical protein